MLWTAAANALESLQKHLERSTGREL